MTSVISDLVDSLCAQARQMASFVSQLSTTSSINTFNKVSQPTLTMSLSCKGKDLFVLTPAVFLLDEGVSFSPPII